MRFQGKRVLITGASQGLGLAVAHAFSANGANLMLCARTSRDLKKAALDVMGKTRSGRVCTRPADVSDAEQVDDLIEDTIGTFGGIEVLVCCAGIYGPKGPLQKVDWSEWARTVEINLLGTVLPCRAVLNHMISQNGGKIIIISGGGTGSKPIPNFSAYAASKAAVVRFAETLAEEVKDNNIDVNAIAPGALNTRFLDEVLEAGPEKVGQAFYDKAIKQKEDGGTPMEDVTDLCVFLASAASNGITGKLISAKWDPWKDFTKDNLSPDIYTLRRVDK